jgi:hypothetical protein
MSEYAIKNPTLRKVRNRGYEPVTVWRGGWYSGWRVKVGTKWQYIYMITDSAVRKFPVNSRQVKSIQRGK